MRHAGAFLALLLLPVPPAPAQEPAWAALARTDLQAIHDLLRDNHPGPVDPENSRYREWLAAGLSATLERAAAARSFGDYERALRFYTNGFQDGHVGIGLEISPEQVEWPGFVVGPAADAAVEVTRAEAGSGVQVGDRITHCDGRSVDELMRERVDPYFWNTAIPHERGRHLHRLFHLHARDPIGRLRACRTSRGEVTLKWRRVGREEFARVEAGSRAPAPRLHRVDGVWFVSLPTFAFADDESVERIRALLARLEEKRARLRKSIVVLDVRGNHGGNSAWGRQLAGVIWGQDWVERIAAGFDRTVDWRASDANIEHMARMVEREERAGLAASAAQWGRALEAMKAARAEGRPLARVESRPRAGTGPPPPPRVSGRIFLLTDNACASACLDFADLVRRLPESSHVGLPTSADAVYIDNTYAMLPSGVAGLGYSLKVYRNRVRGNNEWYEPDVRWPGGAMTDTAVARWVKALPVPAR
jgi:hypothetical protein